MSSLLIPHLLQYLAIRPGSMAQHLQQQNHAKCEIHDLRTRFRGSNLSRHFYGNLFTPFHQDS